MKKKDLSDLKIFDPKKAALQEAAPMLLSWLKWMRASNQDRYPDDVTINGLTLDQAIAKAEGRE